MILRVQVFILHPKKLIQIFKYLAFVKIFLVPLGLKTVQQFYDSLIFRHI